MAYSGVNHAVPTGRHDILAYFPRVSPGAIFIRSLRDRAHERAVKRKVPVSVRLDPDVLEWLRAKGESHLTRINDILANLMEAERRAGSGRS